MNNKQVFWQRPEAERELWRRMAADPAYRGRLRYVTGLGGGWIVEEGQA